MFVLCVKEVLHWIRLLWITAIRLGVSAWWFIVGATVFLAVLKIGAGGWEGLITFGY